MEKEILYKYFEGIASPEEENAVYRWLDASSENEGELLKEREFFDAMIFAGSTDEKTEGKKLALNVNKGPFIRPRSTESSCRCGSDGSLWTILLCIRKERTVGCNEYDNGSGRTTGKSYIIGWNDGLVECPFRNGVSGSFLWSET